MQQFNNKSANRQKEEQEAMSRHKEAQEIRLKSLRESKRRRNKIMMWSVVFILVAGAGYGVYYALSPGPWDTFAKCLTEKGVKMAGEDWCPYTNAQKNMFGSSFKYIDYHEQKDLKVRPTWMIDGKEYGTVQSFEKLSELTGCPL